MKIFFVVDKTTHLIENMPVLSLSSVQVLWLSLIHISEPTRLGMISYAVFCLKKKEKKMVILFGLARRTARNSRKYRYFTRFESQDSGVLRREFPEALELAGQDIVRSRVVVRPEQSWDQEYPVVRLEQRIDDRSVIVEHMTRFARRVRAGAVGRDLAVVAHSAAIHVD